MTDLGRVDAAMENKCFGCSKKASHAVIGIVTDNVLLYCEYHMDTARILWRKQGIERIYCNINLFAEV